MEANPNKTKSESELNEMSRGLRYYYRHRDEILPKERARQKKRYYANKTRENKRTKAYYQAHKEELKAKAAAWRDAHRAEINAYHREYYRAHYAKPLGKSEGE